VHGLDDLVIAHPTASGVGNIVTGSVITAGDVTIAVTNAAVASWEASDFLFA
jgi:hypothetical protein